MKNNDFKDKQIFIMAKVFNKFKKICKTFIKKLCKTFIKKAS